MLRETAEKDPLTGIANRRQMDRTIDDQLSLFKRTGIPFSIIMVDLDNFKQINDSLGHSVGDMALVLFTQLLQRECRGTDLFARFGGDEFLLLLRQQRLPDANQTALRMRSVISDYAPEELDDVNFRQVSALPKLPWTIAMKVLSSGQTWPFTGQRRLGRNRVETV